MPKKCKLAKLLQLKCIEKKMNISQSYDDLLKQVESLKSENTNLRQELQDNSSHLSKLETEACSMKDVLTHLQTAMQDDLDTTHNFTQNGSIVNEMASSMLDQNFNAKDDTLSENWMAQANALYQLETSSVNSDTSREGEAGDPGGGDEPALNTSKGNNNSGSPTSESPSKKRSGDREIYTFIQDLDKERTSVLREIEMEDKRRKWYYDQLEDLQKKLDTLPVSDTYNLQADMSRRQLEYEAQRVRELMTEDLGTSEQIAQRHDARLQRIRMIEREMLRLQQRHRDQQVADQEKRDSGTCDHLETERDGVIVVDVACNTVVTGETGDEVVGGGGGGGNLQDEQGLQNQNLASLYHGGWPLQHNGSVSDESLQRIAQQQDTASVMSFNSCNNSTTSRHVSNHHLGTKVEMVYSLLSMLGTHDKDDMSRTLLAMSSSQDSCIAMRQSGCLPLLIQLLHGNDKDSGLLGNTRGSKAARARAAAALHNIVHSHPDDKRGRREARVLRLLEQIRAHCDQLRETESKDDENEEKKHLLGSTAADIDHHPGPAIAALMKLSFDEEHRHAICTLGGLQAIAELLEVDHEINGATTENYNITMRRYACMALTNLTFGDGTNKALLCSMKSCMLGLVAQLQSYNEDLRQVAASVLRNLSWRADLASKKTLREVGAVTALMQAAMEVKKESTLKSILSALWNLSAHCSENKADICSVDSSLAFLVSSLTYKSPSKTLAIIENGGGILRNISSHIAVREDYRIVLRQHGCLQILLKHLRSPSLTIVSNACGTLWNLSARCPEDQKTLWEMGAVSMLRNLVHSKHKMISMGSAAALKNLLAVKPPTVNFDGSDARGKSNMPSLHVRKQKAMEAMIDQNLAETCDNVESPQGSPTETRKHMSLDGPKFMHNGDNIGIYQMEQEHRRPMMRGYHGGRNASVDGSPLIEKLRSPSRSVSRSASQDSVGSVHSDISHDRSRTHNVLAKSSKLLQERQNMNIEKRRDVPAQRYDSEGQRSPEDRNGGNNRIVQVMQEVALHAGLESGYQIPSEIVNSPYLRESQSAENTPPSSRRTNAKNMPRDPRRSYQGQNGRTAEDINSFNQRQRDQVQLASIAQRMGNLHLAEDLEPTDDMPVNYGYKYADTRNPTGFVKPVPKVGNYVAGMSHGPQHPQQQAGNAGSPEKSNNPQSQAFSGENIHLDMPQLPVNTGYAETDLDNTDEQPTNFSIRFAEQDDDGHVADQPINFSSRFQESEAESRRARDIPEPVVDEDTMRTYYTEGTPFLSTATSMDDLTKAGAEDSAQQKRGATAQKAFSDSSEPRTASTVVSRQSGVKNRVQVANIQNNNVPQHQETTQQNSKPEETDLSSGPNSHPPSMYSYNDSSGTGSPSDRPKHYSVEGTPTCFSRASSLSSLHSSEADSESTNNNPRLKDLQSIDENSSLEITVVQRSADVTMRHELRDDSFNQSHNTSLGSNCTDGNMSGHANKSVTFDENNQVQETPLMFSRCSSLGSLSSFDAHSVHSSVVSEYSRRASEVVSPSDLPDSPSDTMPPSPTHCKSPAPATFGSIGQPVPNNGQATLLERPAAMKAHEDDIEKDMSPRTSGTGASRVFNDAPVAFATEESPPGMSSATSLSALTIDDEPKMEKEPELRRIPLGEEHPPPARSLFQDFAQASANVTVIENANDTANTVSLDVDNLSGVSEGEEDLLLAECISMAMPTASSKKKMKKSSSDGHIKKRSQLPKPTSGANAYTPKNTGIPTRLGQLGMRMSPKPSPLASKMHASYPGPVDDADDDYYGGGDSPRKFATEGTPLNFSRCESPLSDISFGIEPGTAKTPNKSFHQPKFDSPPKSAEKDSTEEVHSDVSSVSGDCEDLLSAAIEAAMPKNASKTNKRQQMLIDRKAEGSATKDRQRFQSPHFKQPNRPVASAQIIPQRMPQSQVVRPLQRPTHTSVSSDTVKTYAEEGTPINFSRAESPLSQMSDMDFVRNDEHQEETFREIPNPLHDLDDDFLEDTDSPKVYGVEGTPLNFSRCESPLSQMTFNEDFEFNPDSTLIGNHITSTPGMQNMGGNIASGPGSHSNAHSISSRKPGSGLSSPGSAKNSAMRQPVQRTLQYQDIPDREEDMPLTYAVEDTPACFSRNSSLSELNNVENINRFEDSNDSTEMCEAEAMGIPHDQNRSYLVEDTPAVLSGNSSLSELSVDSEIDLESENDLLAECINAAMPKSKPRSHKKGSRSSRKSPTGANRSQDEAEFRDSQSKNVKVPQPNAKIEKAATDDEVSSSCRELADGADGITSPGSDVSDGMLKQMKNASNNEKVLSSSDQTASSTSDVIEPPAEFLSPPAEFNDIAKRGARIAASLAEGHLSMSTSSEMTDSMFERNISNEAEGICGILENCESPGSEELPIIAKEDVEATKEDVFGDEEFVEENVEEEDNMFDITQETMPEMGVSMISNSTAGTPEGENVPQNLITGAHGCIKTPVEEAKFFLPEGDDTEENEPTEEGEYETNISLEEERALEENANLIVAEISNLSMDLSTSTISDDLLEQETISLVSNTDYNSDSGSEVSVSLSCSSKTMSDRGEISSSNTPSAASSAHSTPQKKPGRPRILKPGEESARKPPVPDEAVSKGIRGKRKALYPGARSMSASPKRGGVGSAVSPKPVTRTPPKAVTPGQHKARNTTPIRPGVSPLVGKTPPKTPPRASSVGQSLLNRPLTTVKNRSSSAGAITASPDKNKSNSPASTGIGQRTVTAIYRPNAGTKAKTTTQSAGKKAKAESKEQESKNVIERPKPPIKQGTFTKDSPTHSSENLPSVSNDSEGQTSKRLSTLSSSSSRSSAELKYSNDSQEKLSGIPGTEAVKLREKRISAGSPPPRDSGSHSETEPKNTKTGSNSSLNKTQSKTGLTRLGSGSRNSSGSSINKSGSSLNKTSSGSSLRSSSKSSLSSDGSLRKNSVDRSSTPPRKSSTSSNASGTSIPTPSKKTNKKPAVSRIASLWKKSDNSPKVNEKPVKKAESKKDDKVGIKSPKTGKRSLMPFKSNKTEQSKPEKKPTPLTRSGTYDKLPTNPVEAETMDDVEDQSCASAAAAKDNIWRRTYTITNDQDNTAVVEIIADGCVDTTTKAPAPAKWRRHASESSADVGETQEKVAGWRRTASTQESSPTDYAGRCMVQFDGVWTRGDDDKTSSKSGIPAPSRAAGSGIPTKLPVGKKSGSSQLPVKRTTTTREGNASKPVHLPVTSTGKPQMLDIKSPTNTGAPAAIVQPFNYTPSPTTQSQQQPIQGGQQQEEPKVEESSVPKPPMDLPVKPQYITQSNVPGTASQQSQNSSSPPTKHLTKTEMLIERRRRSYLNSIQKGEGSSKEDVNEKKNKSASCLVTTV